MIAYASARASLTLDRTDSNVAADFSTSLTMPVKKPQAPDFEQAMAELEALVKRLEQGELPLDEALKQFERGVELTGACQAALKSAEQKVEILLRKSGQSEVAEFEPETGDDDAAP
jgi:exodeoxyribonuclease VII small subunit